MTTKQTHDGIWTYNAAREDTNMAMKEHKMGKGEGEGKWAFGVLARFAMH